MSQSSRTMTMPTTDPQAETAELRERAVLVLQSLEDARRRCTEHLVVVNRIDVMAEVTGCSSLDRAIDSAQQTIDTLDQATPTVVVARVSVRSGRAAEPVAV